MIGMPAAWAAEITWGPICWSGTTMMMPSTFCEMAESTSLIALLESVPRSTTLTVTSPSSFAASFAPVAWSTKYCWSPCFCRYAIVSGPSLGPAEAPESAGVSAPDEHAVSATRVSAVAAIERARRRGPAMLCRIMLLPSLLVVATAFLPPAGGRGNGQVWGEPAEPRDDAGIVHAHLPLVLE